MTIVCRDAVHREPHPDAAVGPGPALLQLLRGGEHGPPGLGPRRRPLPLPLPRLAATPLPRQGRQVSRQTAPLPAWSRLPARMRGDYQALRARMRGDYEALRARLRFFSCDL